MSFRAVLNHFLSSAIVAKSERAAVAAGVPLVIAALASGQPVDRALAATVLVAAGRAVLAVFEKSVA